MDKELQLLKMYKCKNEFIEENKFSFVFMKVGELFLNGILTEVFIAPMESGSLVRIIDSIITESKERQIISINYIKSDDIHMVQSTDDGRFRMIYDHGNSLSSLLDSDEITFNTISIEEDEDDKSEIQSSEPSDNKTKDIVRLGTGTNKNETEMNSPKLETPNRVHLDSRENADNNITNTEPNHSQKQQVINSRDNLRQRFSNPNKNNNNNFQVRNQQQTYHNENRSYQQNNQNNRNKEKRNSNFKPILSPTTSEIIS